MIKGDFTIIVGRQFRSDRNDIRLGDPDAALKFRQIVRANEILGDVEQRAAYDHLLELARLEPESASEHTIVARGPAADIVGYRTRYLESGPR